MHLSSTGKRLLALALPSAVSVVLGADPSVVERAESALQAGHPRQAEQLIRGALRSSDHPELQSEWHRLLADSLEAQGDYKAASEEYRTAATADSSELNLFAFGSELLKYHGYSQALQVFTWAAQRFPHSARIVVGLGVAQYSLGQYDEAVATLCRAVDLDPTDTRALTFLGTMTGVSTALAEEVESRLKGFAERYPRNASALYYYALTLDKNPAASQQLLESALSLQPQFPEAHFHLGILYQQQKQTAKAIAQFEQAVAQRPSLTAARYRLGQLYLQQGKKRLADQQFAAVKSAPGKNQPARSAAESK